MIIYIEVVIRRKQNSEAAAQSAMLHRIIEDYHIQLRQLTLQLFNAPHPTLAYRYRHFRKLTVQLHCLIPDGLYGCIAIGQEETVRLALVSAREHRRVKSVIQQQLQQILHHRRLTRSAYRQVTHAYRRYGYRERG